MYSSSWVWPQAVPAFLVSRFSSVKWDFSPKAPPETLGMHREGSYPGNYLCVWAAVTIWSQAVCRAGGGWVSPANPGFLQETETEQRDGAFLIELKGGVGRFQKPPRVAKSRVFNSK